MNSVFMLPTCHIVDCLLLIQQTRYKKILLHQCFVLTSVNASVQSTLKEELKHEHQPTAI